MTKRDRKLAAVASLLVTVSVAVNMAAFQEKGQGSPIETGGITARTAWVDTPGPASAVGPIVPGVVNAKQPAAAAAPTPATSTADDVNIAEITRGVQRELNARGYEVGQPDGAAGLVTQAAIFAYEYDNSLVLTAKPSEPLLGQLVLGSSSLMANGGRPGQTMTPEAEALVRTVKQQLSALGYQTGVADGTLTPEFARAIREFESDQKLTKSGRISGPLMSRLIRLQNGSKAQRNGVARTTQR
jgi:peptidoglycan hydrolase-like protein with peptidoglycan-binding domain